MNHFYENSFQSRGSRRYSPAWWIRAKISDLLLGHQRKWGFARLCSIFLLLLLILAGGFFAERMINILTFHAEENRAFLEWLRSTFSLRAIFLPVLVLIFLIFTAGRYISDIYGIENIRMGVHYILASAFALSYPYLQVSGGKPVLKPRKKNLMDAVGGPGYIDIDSGNAVLFETLNGPSNILAGTRRHFVNRFERIKEIVELCDQNDSIEETKALTRDGIEVFCRGIRYQFRVYSGRPAGPSYAHTLDTIYPFSKRAIYDIAYHRSVSDRGINSWRQAVKQIVDAEITDYVANHWFDELTVPMESENPEDPRVAIHNKLWSAATRKKFKEAGAELVWCDIGYFDNPEGEKARMDLRAAQWNGKSHILRTEGEAEQERLQELGRAQGQADILLSIIQALESLNLTQDPRENLRSVFLARTAQVLEAISSRSDDKSK